MGSVSSEWIEAIRARLETRFPDRKIQFHGQDGPMGPVVFTASRQNIRAESIRLPAERFEDYQSIEEILPEQVLDTFENEGSLILNNDNTISLDDPTG